MQGMAYLTMDLQAYPATASPAASLWPAFWNFLKFRKLRELLPIVPAPQTGGAGAVDFYRLKAAYRLSSHHLAKCFTITSLPKLLRIRSLCTLKHPINPGFRRGPEARVCVQQDRDARTVMGTAVACPRKPSTRRLRPSRPWDVIAWGGMQKLQWRRRARAREHAATRSPVVPAAALQTLGRRPPAARSLPRLTGWRG